VRRFPEADQHWQVTFNGGRFPQWIGSEVFFVDVEVHRGGIPPALGEVIYKALEKDPASLYQDVEQMIRDLRRIDMTTNDERVQ
jgi:hypothetical protein